MNTDDAVKPSWSVSTKACSILGCKRPVRARGWCVTHWSRWKRTGDPLKGGRDLCDLGTPSLEERFWVKVKKTRGCWLWIGATTNGYGMFGVCGKTYHASRVSFALENKIDVRDIPSRVLVCHKCDNPLCVRPSHLFLGSHQDNTDDMFRKGRARPAVGEDSGRAKLTERLVLQIRKETGSSRFIANKFGVSYTAIQAIRNRKSWRHI